MEAFEELAEKEDICLATNQRILNNAPEAAFDKLVKNLLNGEVRKVRKKENLKWSGGRRKKGSRKEFLSISQYDLEKITNNLKRAVLNPKHHGQFLD